MLSKMLLDRTWYMPYTYIHKEHSRLTSFLGTGHEIEKATNELDYGNIDKKNAS